MARSILELFGGNRPVHTVLSKRSRTVGTVQTLQCEWSIGLQRYWILKLVCVIIYHLIML